MAAGVLFALGCSTSPTLGPSLPPTSSPSPTTTPATPAPPPTVEAGRPPSPLLFPAEIGPAPEALRTAIDAIVAPRVDPTGAAGKAVGAAVGVLGPGLRAVLSYGATGPGADTAPAADTLFEIGSNTKVMTGLMLAQESSAGAVRLDDPVVSYLPSGAVVPSFSGTPIALLHLATHTSGLPDYPDNMVGSPPNPAAGYTPALLYDFLGRAQLSSSPGTAFAYSNVAFGLLGIALTQKSGARSYEALFVERIADVLGMNDTRVTPPSASAARTAQGTRQGAVVPAGLIDTLEGAGALRSTAADMLRFLAASVAPPPAMKDAVRASQVVRFDLAGRKMALGVGVEAKSGRTYFAKDGQTPGFTSQIRYTVDPPAAVVVLTNTGGLAGLPALTERVLEEVLAATGKPAGP